MPNLPTPKCPAAELLAGPPTRGPSVICRVMRLQSERVDSILHGAVGGALITDRDHGSILRGFCCGKGLPKVHEGQAPRGHFTYCPVWEMAEAVERERRKAEEPIFPVPEKPKILGIDREVEAELLGIDPEQVPERSPFAPQTTVGVEAMKEVVTDPEWKES